MCDWMVLMYFNAEKSAKSTPLVIRIDTGQQGTKTWPNSARGKYGQFSTEYNQDMAAGQSFYGEPAYATWTGHIAA